MQGRKELKPQLFYTLSLERLVPEDHELQRFAGDRSGGLLLFVGGCGNCKHVKGLAKLRTELAVRPSAVRN